MCRPALALVNAMLNTRRDVDFRGPLLTSRVAVGGIIGVVPGVLVGAIAGLAIKSEKWVPVSVPSVSQLRVAPRAAVLSRRCPSRSIRARIPPLVFSGLLR